MDKLATSVEQPEPTGDAAEQTLRQAHARSFLMSSARPQRVSSALTRTARWIGLRLRQPCPRAELLLPARSSAAWLGKWQLGTRSCAAGWRTTSRRR